MIDNGIYSRDVLELAGNIPRIGRLGEPDASVTAQSRLCGSSITVDIALDGDVVADFAMDIHACALGQAAASAVAAAIVGATAGELRDAREAMRRMLKENGPPPTGRFARLAVLEAARDYKARHPAIMLVFDAVNEALEQAAAKRTASASP